jgi:hypothetical protein
MEYGFSFGVWVYSSGGVDGLWNSDGFFYIFLHFDTCFLGEKFLFINSYFIASASFFLYFLDGDLGLL